MIRFLSGAFALSLLALPAAADCLSEIDALFDGPLDSFQRPPHRQVQTHVNADGTTAMTIDNIVETPVRSRAGARDSGYFALTIESEMWQGPGLDGPWTAMGAILPPDRADFYAQIDADRRANLTEAECFGTVDLDGTPVEKYAFRTRTNPDPQGLWFGAHHTVFIDPAIGQIARWEFRDNQAHYAPEPDDETIVTVFDYSDPPKIIRPE